MADDGKRDEVVCTKVTERMALDLTRIAALDERSVSDFLYRMIRLRLYGEAARLSTTTASHKVDP
jgi:hypothetical protein